ncbi:neurotrophin 1 [Pectinophora gossypiella]|uniref:neurotrophin 1 n=1 Tax=Pectinophora gossypiella TaxID=13191 RepID=UPI00214E66A4|nr:neurotrophin 1 [Pectinophora gossypiella]
MAGFRVLSIAFFIVTIASFVLTEDDLKDFEFSDPEEMMLATESRHYQTVVKPPVRIIKPTGVTNSHRPQYNIDSLEEDFGNSDLEDFFGATTKRSILDYKSQKMRSKEGMIKDAVLRALERKDHVGKFAQILPIIRAMSGNQRVALASLVASQVSTPPGRAPLNLAQVRSMFGNNDNTTSDLMLPILLDMANLIRRAVRSGKEQREVKQPLTLPQAQLLRRSFNEDTYLDDEPFEVGVKAEPTTTKAPRTRRIPPRNPYIRNRTLDRKTETNITDKTDHNRTDSTPDTEAIINTNENTVESDKNLTKSFSSLSTSTTEVVTTMKAKAVTPKVPDNSSLDLAADATNQTLAQDLPVAEKLRAFNRFIDRKGNLIRRGTYPPKPSPALRRSTPEPTVSPISRRRPPPARKLPAPAADQGKCELFTNTLCLHSDDYPTEAIIQSIRRNKAAAGALLADFKDPGEGALDGVTAAQEAKYTADHYLTSNRRGDTANRDFASAGEAGFMCPSTVKYARPQRARATSGQWKYIVNTGEHTQTLRLEKCLKPKESCTYLTDNFRSKCVQVYNYHRLLTWDQQNGLHMDIFKVPTCCSCHIEGYSVSFPPLGHRVHETSNEQFPGEDLSAEHGNQAFEQVQSSVHRPTKSPPFTHKKPLDSFPPFTDGHNLIAGSPFVNKLNDNDDTGNLPPTNPMDSYGNTYFPDSFNQASNIRNVKRPLSRNPIAQASQNFDQVTLPSYLEPPTPSAPAFSFAKDSKFKHGSNFKRGTRPNRRPIRKKIGGPEPDLTIAGSSAVENLETMEDFNDDLEEAEVVKTNVNVSPVKRATISPKLHSVTTEKPSTTSKPDQKTYKESISTNGKRVNYNYHPIIDFFEEDGKEEDESIYREDTITAFVPSPESEWKPINHPPSRNIQTSNLVGRKKHK